MDNKEILSPLVSELRRGVIVLSVLLKLDRPMYGYNLISELNSAWIPVEANTLYPLLRRLEGQGLLESRWETGESKPRKYYVVTEKGREIRRSLLENWSRTVDSIKVLTEENQ